MAGEAGLKFGGVFSRENNESTKMMAFSLSKQLGNIQRDCLGAKFLETPKTPPTSKSGRARGGGVFGSELE